jgi:hypothetical protein
MESGAAAKSDLLAPSRLGVRTPYSFLPRHRTIPSPRHHGDQAIRLPHGGGSRSKIAAPDSIDSNPPGTKNFLENSF